MGAWMKLHLEQASSPDTTFSTPYTFDKLLDQLSDFGIAKRLDRIRPPLNSIKLLGRQRRNLNTEKDPSLLAKRIDEDNSFVVPELDDNFKPG
jgi:hypothetical protein